MQSFKKHHVMCCHASTHIHKHSTYLPNTYRTVLAGNKLKREHKLKKDCVVQQWGALAPVVDSRTGEPMPMYMQLTDTLLTMKP